MIRLQRIGRKNQPYFRFVLTESQNSTKSGKFHSVLGFFDFRKGGKHLIDGDKVKYWISKGAQVSDTVSNYLIAEKIIEGKKKNVLPRKSPVKSKEAEAKEAKEGGQPKDATKQDVPKVETEGKQEEMPTAPTVDEVKESPKEEVKA